MNGRIKRGLPHAVVHDVRTTPIRQLTDFLRGVVVIINGVISTIIPRELRLFLRRGDADDCGSPRFSHLSQKQTDATRTRGNDARIVLAQRVAAVGKVMGRNPLRH